ncbi:MAG: SWIM zinc finger family protein [Egicoccus sp.]
MAPRRPTSRGQDWYPPSAPARPVEGGLRARSRRGPIAESWWSHRFLDLLESLGIGGRLDRGKTYARKGQVISLDVARGEVTAQVQGSRPRPYKVRIGLPRLSETDWRRAEEAMASRAAFLALLLAGQMPDDIETAFAGCTASLFPAGRGELDPNCSCPDWASPCKHVAAVYYLLAEAFDDDPFLILAWRGRPREELLGNLRALRGRVEGAAADRADHDPWAPIEQVEVAPMAERLAQFWRAGPELAGLHLDPRTPRPADAAVRALVPLEREVAGRPLTELLQSAYEVLTADARDRLLSGG